MKVIQINVISKTKSTGRIVSELSNYLNKNGHKSYVACSKGLLNKGDYKIGNILDNKFHGLFSRVFGLQGYFSLIATKNLLKYIDKINPDIVHLHNLHGNYINIKLILNYLAKNNIPTVLTLHDCWFYTGKCTHYTVDNCYKWEKGCKNCPRLKKDNKSWFFDRTKKMYKDKKLLFESISRLAVIGVSDWIANESKKSFLSSASSISRIYNWIDLNTFKPINSNFKNELGLKNKFLILGVASGWSNKKGLDKFLKLARVLKRDEKIVLIGKIEKNIILPKNILHIDETDSVELLIKYYSISDVFLNLSLEESFGKVTAEALACGLPIITNKLTANPELVDKKTGIILEKVDINYILLAIKEIKGKTKKYYSEKCVERAKLLFEKEKLIEDTLLIYKNLIKENKE